MKQSRLQYFCAIFQFLAASFFYVIGDQIMTLWAGGFCILSVILYFGARRVESCHISQENEEQK